jgi:hypothetical protein
MSIISAGGAVVGAGAAAGGYQIERSLRFNSADSAYLNRTPQVAGNRIHGLIVGGLSGFKYHKHFLGAGIDGK